MKFAYKRMQELVKEKRGVAMLEFAILAPVLLLFILGIFLLGYLYFAQMALEDSAASTERLLQTNQTTAPVCNSLLLNCANINMSAIQVADAYNNGGSGFPATTCSGSGGYLLSTQIPYVVEGTGTMYILQMTYQTPISIPLFSGVLKSC